LDAEKQMALHVMFAYSIGLYVVTFFARSLQMAIQEHANVQKSYFPMHMPDTAAPHI
jgi:hypothetical protein